MKKVAVTDKMFGNDFLDLFPFVEEYNPFHDYELVIFPGGEDVTPQMYAERNIASNTNMQRDSLERSIFWDVYGKSKILGICRGCQLINVLLGGILIQDTKHAQWHEVNIMGDSIFPNPKRINSYHHQGVIKPGYGLRPIWKHGVVYEGLVSDNIMTFQFHPEYLEDNYQREFFDIIGGWANV